MSCCVLILVEFSGIRSGEIYRRLDLLSFSLGNFPHPLARVPPRNISSLRSLVLWVKTGVLTQVCWFA